jgi:hypothetical protein
MRIRTRVLRLAGGGDLHRDNDRRGRRSHKARAHKSQSDIPQWRGFASSRHLCPFPSHLRKQGATPRVARNTEGMRLLRNTEGMGLPRNGEAVRLPCNTRRKRPFA